MVKDKPNCFVGWLLLSKPLFVEKEGDWAVDGFNHLLKVVEDYRKTGVIITSYPDLRNANQLLNAEEQIKHQHKEYKLWLSNDLNKQ